MRLLMRLTPVAWHIHNIDMGVRDLNNPIGLQDASRMVGN